MKNKELTIGFIGGGRITRILLHVWKQNDVGFKNIKVYEPQADTMVKLATDFKGIDHADSIPVLVKESDVIFLAIHPPVFADVLVQMKGNADKSKLLISLSPKVKIEKIKQALGVDIPVARVIPNAPSVIGKGHNGYSLSNEVNEEQSSLLGSVFQPLGQWVKVDESKLEAYATIAGMGPTYLWFLFNEIYNLAIKCGMDKQEAKVATNAMIKGSADTLLTSGLDYEQVLNLIPAYPMRPKEEDVKSIYSEVISELFHKLSN